MKRIFIFDIGNVLMSFQPLVFLNDIYSDRNLADRLELAVFGSEEWPMLDRGELTDSQAAPMMAEHAPDIAAQIKEVLEGWPRIMKPIRETIELVNDLKNQGAALYYLSNMPYSGADYLIANYDFINLFCGGIFSAREGMVKPEKEIFELLLSRYDLCKDKCVFIDDIKENIDTAKSLGIESILFESAKQLKKEISALRDE